MFKIKMSKNGVNMSAPSNAPSKEVKVKEKKSANAYLITLLL